MTKATYRAGSIDERVEEFEYDLVGNRTRQVIDGVARRYGVNLADELETIETDDPSPVLLERFGNDLLGRRIEHETIGEGVVTHYDYDGFNRLIGAEKAGAFDVDIRYDALGERMSRLESGVEAASYFSEWVETRGGVPRRLVHSAGIDNVLAEASSAEVLNLVQDAAGNVVRVDTGIDPPDLLVPNGSFEGPVQADGDPVGWDVTTFSGQPWDTTHGLWSLDPSIGYSAGSRAMRIDLPDIDNTDPDTSTNVYILQSQLEVPEPGVYALSACFLNEDLVVRGIQLSAGARDNGTYVAGPISLNSSTTPDADWDCQITSDVLDLTTAQAASANNMSLRARVLEDDGSGNHSHGSALIDNVKLIPVQPDGQGGWIPQEDPAEDNSYSPLNASQRYEAFGAPRSTPAYYPVERGFAGRPTEGPTGLLYLRARHYDPHTGRFLQPDPLGMDTDQLYAYAGNNPYRFRDPLGLTKGLSPAAGFSVETDYPPSINFAPEEPTSWHFSSNQIVIDLAARNSVKEALATVRQDFSTFASFNPGNIATARVDSGKAYFDLSGWKGVASDYLTFNDDEVAVSLSHSHAVQVAVTLGDHQLQGVRAWYAAQTGQHQIAITTVAFEKPNGRLNWLGFNAPGPLGASEDQRIVWDTYFSNIDKAYFGGNGRAQPFVSVNTSEVVNPLIGYVKR